MSSDQAFDRELLARLNSGDEDCLVRLLSDYEPEIRRVARLRLGPLLRPHLDSVDLVQSVCVALIEGFRHEQFAVSDPEKLVALASGIIRRKVARTWRRCRRESAAEERLAAEADRSAQQRSDASDPAEEVRHREEIAQLLGRLDPADRQLVELRLAGCSTAEAARRLGADADVLRVRLSRLRKRLTAGGWNGRL